MILLWGMPGDPPLDAVHRMLLRSGAPTLLVDQRRPEGTSLTMEIGQGLTGTLIVGARCVALEDISGMYLRPQDTPACAALDDLLLTVAELAPGVVLNRPDAMAANTSKPYQYSQIRAAGFSVPDTLITTSPDAAREFIAHHGSVIYKSVSGVRSVVGMLREADGARLSEIRWCPTQLQQRIRGVDVRVHVVGDALFACEVRSDAVDYRYAHLSGADVELSTIALPDECADRCLALARAARLPLAGIDFRRTDDGEWYCFEINPWPGFTYYQQATGAPIDAAIATLLGRSPQSPAI
jgi:glutathione synthase/RimK-type ligase-like ATP-grasp enzyme